MHPVLCTNTHHDVTDLVNHGLVKNTKTWICWKQNIIFLPNKKILDLCPRWHILRSYRFLVEVTFKGCLNLTGFRLTLWHIGLGLKKYLNYLVDSDWFYFNKAERLLQKYESFTWIFCWAVAVVIQSSLASLIFLGQIMWGVWKAKC